MQAINLLTNVITLAIALWALLFVAFSKLAAILPGLF